MASHSSSLRPTKAVVLQALRNILRPVVRGTRVLDLFAGSGRVGTGLLEEGAATVVGVDRREAPEGLPEDYKWIRRDVHGYLSTRREITYDIVYLDPPYKSNYASTLLPKLASINILSRYGIVGVETDAQTSLPTERPVEGSLYLMRRRKYGGTRLWIYQKGRDREGYKD